MRKKSIVNAVVAFILVGLAALVLFLTPFQVAGKNLSMIKMGDVTPNALISIVKNAPATFMNLFAALGFTGSSASAITFSKFGMPWILFGGLIFLVLVWLIQFIGFIAKRRGSGTVCTILYLITAAAGYMILLSAVTAGAIVPGATIASIVKGGLDFSGNFVRKAIVVGQLAYTALPFVLAVVALIMAIVYEFQSLADAVKNGKKRVKKAKEAKSAKNAKLGTVKEDEPAPAATEETKPEEKPVDEAALKAAQYEELAKANQIELNTESHGPQIVQNFYASAPAPQPAPAPVQYVPYPYPPFPPYYPYPQPEPKKEEPAPAPAPEPAPAPAPVVEEDNRPLTAKELREIIAEALDDHDHPENDRPLTDDEARDLIRQELDAYYAGSTPAVEEEPVVETVEDDTLTGDDLRAIIREEIAALAPAPAPEPEPVVEEPAPEPAPAPAISLDDIRSVITDALAAQSAKDAEKEEAQKAVEERQNEAIKAIADSVLTAEEIRTIVSEEMDKKAAEAPAPEPTLSGDDIRAIIREEMAAEEPAPAPEPALSSDDIRAIIREEIASLTPAPAPEPAPAPVAEPAPVEETVVVEPEPVVEEPVAEPAPAPVVYERKTFADRFADCDQSLLDNYNELKAYLLSYGLKSRLSNSGDTFRLSCVTYCKITVAGKGLKLYLALKPSDFADSPIPVIDASAKNIYKDIPTCFKVKSGLSMKRAKQLIDMACTAKQGDNEPLVQGDIVTANYAEELKDYKPQGGDEDGADEE